MTDRIKRRATIHRWDARTAFPDGLTGGEDPEGDLTHLGTRLIEVTASAGQAIVLPGPEAHQAIVVAIDGIDTGAVVEDGTVVYRRTPHQD